MKFTYASVGVDIDEKSESVKHLVDKLMYARKGIGKPLKIEGHFTGMIDFGDYVLTLCTDSVGTKLLVASALNDWTTVGIDCIAMSVNDTICIGAEPVAFVDYIAVDKPDYRVSAQIGIGLEKGAKLANVSIVGGEIAVLPEMVSPLDLVGTCMGYVTKNKIITGSKIRPGDVLVGLKSSGIHSNGLTLARKVFETSGYKYTDKLWDTTVGEELLRPTEIYVRDVLKILKSCEITGLVNITGGGVRNFIRVNPNVRFNLTDPFKPQKIFELIKELGDIDDREMYQTFNMGMGFCIVCSEKNVDKILTSIKDSKVVGEVSEGRGVALPELNLEYKKY